MRVTFNVLDDGWIPVAAMDGTADLLGIRQLLQQAPELRKITCGSPLEEFSIYRFISVFLMDALRPERTSSIRKLLKQGKFDMEAVEGYIDTCAAEGVSFDLFDRERPFMQSKYVPEWDKEAKPAGYLDCMLPTGNNHTHFDHRQAEEQSLPFDKAARLLLTVQQFCTVGAQGYPSGVNASPPYFGIVNGENLFETLVYTLQPIRTMGIEFDDPCVLWRSKDAVVPKKEVAVTSWLRGMYFPARRVQLIPPEDGSRVRSIYFSQGENYTSKESWRDPFVTYRTLDSGIVPLRPKREKPVWRSLFEIADITGKHASAVLTQYMSLTEAEYADITLYGVETNQASYLGLYRVSLRIPADVTGNPAAIDLLRQSVSAAEGLARKLRKTLLDTRTIPAAVGENAAASFYDSCESHFWELCGAAGKSSEEMQNAYATWCGAIGSNAMEAYRNSVMNLHLRGRDMGSAAVQQKYLAAEIHKLKEGVNK